MLPMPPTTTTTNAAPMVSMSISRLAGLARQLRRSAQACQQRTQCEDGGEQPGLVDAQGTHHFRGPAWRHAPGAKRVLVQQKRQAQEDAGTDRYQEKDRKWGTGGPESPPSLQAPVARGPNSSSGPTAIAQHPDDQYQRKRGQELEQLGRPWRCDAEAVSRSAPRGCAAESAETSSSKGQKPIWGEQVHAAVGDEDAQHIERAMGEVDGAGDTEDQQPDRNQKQRRCAG